LAPEIRRGRRLVTKGKSSEISIASRQAPLKKKHGRLSVWGQNKKAAKTRKMGFSSPSSPELRCSNFSKSLRWSKELKPSARNVQKREKEVEQSFFLEIVSHWKEEAGRGNVLPVQTNKKQGAWLHKSLMERERAHKEGGGTFRHKQ